MAIQIGETKLATRRPADLDEQLLAATGCTAEELAGMLGRIATPAALARAIQPFLIGDEKMELADLASLIEQDTTGTLPGQVAALFGAPLAPGQPTADADA